MAVTYSQNGVIVKGGGDIAAIRCAKSLVANYYEIPVDIDTRHTFEIGCDYSYTGSNGVGIFQCRGTSYYPELDLKLYATSTTSAGYVLESNFNNEITKTLYPNQSKFYHAKIYSTDSDTIMSFTDNAGNVYTASKGSLITLYSLSTLRLFVGGWTNNDTCQGNEIFYLRITDENADVLLDLVPAEQNNVPGFLDNVSGSFYGPLVNDGTFEAVKSMKPI